jgi:hypothetical protein
VTAAEPTVTFSWPFANRFGPGALAGMVGDECTLRLGIEQHPSRIVKFEQDDDTVSVTVTMPPAIADLVSSPIIADNLSIGFSADPT